MSRAVRIEVRSVGQAFACAGHVVDVRSGESLASTRDYPHGQRGNAYAAGEAIASERGWTNVDTEVQS